MCQYIETIRIERGKPLNVKRHQQRLEATMKHFWPEADVPGLFEYLTDCPMEEKALKARIVYGEHGFVKKEYCPYSMRRIGSLRVVGCDLINYEYKSLDRTMLEDLMSKRNGCDDILVIRNGLLTDTSYTNVALFDGYKWLTPKRPLLRGTMRQKLLEERLVEEADIPFSSIGDFRSLAMFNSMIDFCKIIIDVKNIML